jgi:hypothetical protein
LGHHAASNTPAAARAIHRHRPGLTLGGWASPRKRGGTGRTPLSERANADFYLTQIVSHHNAAKVEQFVEEGRRRGLMLPGLFGIFYYRSSQSEDAERAQRVSAGSRRGLTREFGEGASAEGDLRAVAAAAVGRGRATLHVSNLPLGRA